MKKTQDILKENNIRLQKIVSNSPEVVKQFSKDELSDNASTIIEDKDSKSEQSTLGMAWEFQSDNFSFSVLYKDDITTKRQMLSFVNSIFDPIGFLAPLIVHGRILLREVTSDVDWDENIPAEKLLEWKKWMRRIADLGSIKIPRMFVPFSVDDASDKEFHIYCDASENAVSAAAYVQAKHKREHYHTGFIMGRSKLAPMQGHTIPRLELCSAVLAVEIGETISEALNLPLENMKYHSDSRIVLGYIANKTKRFHMYVSNRVERILRSSTPEQWTYVNTEKNPADKATRTCANIENFESSLWLKGPEVGSDEALKEEYPLVNPVEDPEIRQEKVKSFKIQVEAGITEKFKKFSTWRCLVRVIMTLKMYIRKFKQRKSDEFQNVEYVEMKSDSEMTIIRCEQNALFPQEISDIKQGKCVSKASPIRDLNPFIDKNGVLRVGGRLNNYRLSEPVKNPVILHRKKHISELVVKHSHEKTSHQGRLITEAALRNLGYWIIGTKRLISTVIFKCVICRKLRGKSQIQQMSNLPEDRLQPGPPFTSVGVDAFGPWMISSRKTRSGTQNTKRWAIIFTCMTTRAIHIEVIEDMSSSCFINALRRLVSLRGEVREIRSDCGTNFIGAAKDLKANVIKINEPKVSEFLKTQGITWRFNPPIHPIWVGYGNA